MFREPHHAVFFVAPKLFQTQLPFQILNQRHWERKIHSHNKPTKNALETNSVERLYIDLLEADATTFY